MQRNYRRRARFRDTRLDVEYLDGIAGASWQEVRTDLYDLKVLLQMSQRLRMRARACVVGGPVKHTAKAIMHSTLTSLRNSLVSLGLVLVAAGQVSAAAPVIHDLSHFSLWHAGGEKLTIWGANLTGTSSVTIGGNPVAELVVVDDSKVTCKTTPQNPVVLFGTGDLVLTSPGGVTTFPAIPYQTDPKALERPVRADWAVQVEAEVAEVPPSITLKWPVVSRATDYAISRRSLAGDAWHPVGTAAGSASSWQDPSVVAGQAYEYQVIRNTKAIYHSTFTGATRLMPMTGIGYIYAGISVPPVDHRGTVILIVDNTMAGPCSAELARLRDDLIGDGWSVIRHDVRRGSLTSTSGPVPYDAAGVTEVKDLIKNEYLKNPREVKSVFLFGHVPVPYSGNFSPGGHPVGHTGAYPADVYYGDMDGVWTDSVIDARGDWFFPAAAAPYHSCLNLPGDGKFDQSFLPTKAELEVGRVDLWGMEAWGGNEAEQLKQYLSKDHKHRHAQKVLPRRVLMGDNTDAGTGPEQSRSGWATWPAIVGTQNVVSGSFRANILTKQEEYLAVCLLGGGTNDRCGDVYSSLWAKEDPKAMVVMSWGSNFIDWDQSSNVLRAPLLSSTYGLISLSFSWPYCYLHTIGLGGTFGEASLLKQNNATSYQPYDPFVGGVHSPLLGDPTLRLFAVKPPAALTTSIDASSHPVLSWQASTDIALLGYHVYRAADSGGPFTRLTTDPITLTTWTDESVSSGTFSYQVKAAKIETTASGTYVNTSQAITATIAAAANPAGTLAFAAAGYAQDEGATSRLPITVTRSGGSSGAVSVRYSASAGTAAAGADYAATQGTLTWAAGDASAKSFTVPIINDTVLEPDETVKLKLTAPTGAATLGTSAALFTIVNDDGPGTIHQVQPAAVKEGDSGTSRMTITCIRVGGSIGKVEVKYATVPFAAGWQPQINGVSAPFAIVGIDYASTQGTLTWADGDTDPKTFDIKILGNRKPQYNKSITIGYSATGAAMYYPQTFHNYILNDDGAVPAAK